MAQNKYTTKMNQRGFASIVIAITLVTVIGLVTVGFAELMRKEQRSALDKHLSKQAFYAAESGVNDAHRAIKAGYNEEKTECIGGVDDSQQGHENLASNKVGTEEGVSYSCLLIDPSPQSLEYTVSQDDTKVSQISGADSGGNPVAITQLMISWQQEAGNFTPMTNTNNAVLPSNASNNWASTAGLLRFSIVPIRVNELGRSQLMSKHYTLFMYPRAGGSSDPNTVVYSLNGVANDNGRVVAGNCSQSNSGRDHDGNPATSDLLACNIRISGLSDGTYLVMMKSFYKNSFVRITGSSPSFSGPVSFINSQAVVDSTGKAQDVLRRIQVRIPLNNSYDMPDTALDVMSGICKELNLVPGTPPTGDTGC